MAHRLPQVGTQRLDARLPIKQQRPAGLIARIQMPNMQLLPNNRTRRNTACTMLLVWLFALASGLANACLLEAHGVRDHGSALLQPSGTGTSPGMAGGHAEGLTYGDADADTRLAKVSCLKACDDSSQTLLKHVSSVDLADPGLAPVVAAAWAAEVRTAAALGRAHDFRLLERAPPIRVLFSRLAL